MASRAWVRSRRAASMRSRPRPGKRAASDVAGSSRFPMRCSRSAPPRARWCSGRSRRSGRHTRWRRCSASRCFLARPACAGHILSQAERAAMEFLQQLAAALGDRYRVERELGHGGMAVVFLAEDLKHHRRVAIKLLKPELSAALGSERFLREIAIAAALQHPHILPLYDSGQLPGGRAEAGSLPGTEGGEGSFLYYVMPFAEGESLRQWLAREPQLPLDAALQITRDAGSALQYAHEHG